VYDNIRTPKIKKVIAIEAWFDLIKNSEYSSLIESARPFKKGHPAYDNVKAALPAITYNFKFRNVKTNANITGGTGLLYVDIDDFNYNISDLDTSKVFAYYKSFGGAGYSILVQVNNLTIENYDATYHTVLNDLGLSPFYDSGAKKATQFTVLSFDPNIFINYDSFVYESSIVPPANVITKKIKVDTFDRTAQFDHNQNIRFNNLNDIEITGNYAFNWDGWEYVNCWLPFKQVNIGARNKTLLSYCNNLVWLNPHLTSDGAFVILNKVNRRICIEPLPLTQVKSIVSSVFKYKQQGTLKPIYNRKPRKIIFANQTGLSAKEKLAICRDLLIDKKQNESLQKIDATVEGWDFNNGKITVRAVAKVASMSKKTVTKYWPEFKETAKRLNDKNKKKGEVDDISLIEILSEPENQELKRTEKLEVNLTDFGIDETYSYYVANYKKYSRALNLITTTPKIMMCLRLKNLIAEGFAGEEIFKADDFEYCFVIHPLINVVEFKNVA